MALIDTIVEHIELRILKGELSNSDLLHLIEEIGKYYLNLKTIAAKAKEMNTELIYKHFQEEFIKNIGILDKKIYIILLGEVLLKQVENKFAIIPILTDLKDLEELKPLINKSIEESGKTIKTKCIISFDVKENEIISSLEYLGETALQEKISINVNKTPIEKCSYQIF